MPRSLVVLFAVLLVDSLDAGMMVPVLPQLFTDADSPALVIAAERTGQLGMLLMAVMGAAYALPAFFAQPLIGQLADRYGRRPLLIASFASSALSFLLFAVGVQWGALWLLTVARVVDGIAAGNLLVAQAAVADATTEDNRTRYFGYFTAALSMGFVLGPLLGGWLGDASAGGWRGPATAFYVAGALNCLAIAAFYFLFAETLDDDDRDDASESFDVLRGLRNAREAFGDDERRPYYLTQLCYIAGYTFYMTFYAVVLTERVGMATSMTGVFFSALGVALMVTQLFVVDRVERWLGPNKLLWVALACAGGAVAVMAFAKTEVWAFAGIVPFALAGGLVDPLIMSLLSKTADDDQQGRIQGVRGSVAALGMAVPPFLAGPLAATGAASWAVLAGAAVIGVGAVIAVRFVGQENADTEREEADHEASEASTRGALRRSEQVSEVEPVG